MVPVKLKKMPIKFILLAILAASCEKEDLGPGKTSAELLTQKDWKLVSHGYDNNNNKIIDVTEENIQDCEKDNTYSFHTNGTGLFEDNALSCGNGVSDHVFTWQFIQQEKVLDFVFGALNILKLDENELILYSDQTNANGQRVRYINIYRH